MKSPQTVLDPVDLGDGEYRALADFRQALREFLAFSDQSALESGVTSQQHQALLAIRGHGAPLSIGELARCLGIKNHSALGLVSRLEERGLVSHRTAEDDRRRVLVELQAEGESILAGISQRNLGQHSRMSGILGELTRTVRRLKPPAPQKDIGPAARISSRS